MKYEDQFDEVDTFEAFYKNIIYKNKILVIPYINVGVSRHPLNPTSEQLYLNKAYVVCIDANINKVNGVLTQKRIIDNPLDYITIHLGGVDVDQNRHIELEVSCKTVYLQILPDSLMRKAFWIPVDTPNFRSNMNPQEVKRFFDHEDLTENIKNLISM